MQEAYPRKDIYFSVYVEGIGTKNPDKKNDGSLSYYGDFTYGQGYGTGETGLFEKVEKCCKDLAEKLSKKVPLPIDMVTIDVFGFSRGSAAARAFIHEITRPKYSATIFKGEKIQYFDLDYKEVEKEDLPARGHLGLLFEEKNIKVNALKIRFVGLYDTVSSYGINFDDDTTDKEIGRAHV